MHHSPEGTWQRLVQLFWQQKLPHALLVSGPLQAVHEISQTLANLVLCQSPQKQGPCGTCRSCNWFKQKIHPDSRCLGEHQSCSIDDIREVTTFLAQTAHQERYKVVTLFGADKLHLVAANALLKTVEEPNEKTLLILIAQNPQIILPTLKSRCVNISIKMPAQHNQEAQETLERHTGAQALKKAWFSPKRMQLDKISQEFFAEQSSEALYLLYYWLSDYIRHSLHNKTGFLYILDARQVTLQEAFRFLDLIIESIKMLMVPGVNKQLLFESLYYQWQQLYVRE